LDSWQRSGEGNLRNSFSRSPSDRAAAAKVVGIFIFRKKELFCCARALTEFGADVRRREKEREREREEGIRSKLMEWLKSGPKLMDDGFQKI
jgi:hypothetical protein